MSGHSSTSSGADPGSGSQQVGGEQEIFIRLGGKPADLDQATKIVQALGGRLLHAFPPKFLVVMLPQAALARLKSGGPIRSVHTGRIDLTGADHDLALAGAAWNNHIDPQRRVRQLADPHRGKPWDEPGHQPPNPPHIQKLFREQEQEFRRIQGSEQSPAVEGAPNYGIPVLSGRIAVGVVWVDSTVNDFIITDQEKSKTLNETTTGLNWLGGLEPSAGVQWFYDFKRPKISLPSNSFTAQNQNSWEDLWRNAALSAMGYSGDLNGLNSYINDIKGRNNAAWAYAVFITKYPKTWFAYTWGNHVVMDFGVDGWGIDNFHIVVAHETGHIFGCPDEYSSANCTCTSLFGRYQNSERQLRELRRSLRAVPHEPQYSGSVRLYPRPSRLERGGGADGRRDGTEGNLDLRPRQRRTGPADRRRYLVGAGGRHNPIPRASRRGVALPFGATPTSMLSPARLFTRQPSVRPRSTAATTARTSLRPALSSPCGQETAATLRCASTPTATTST